MGKRLKIKLKRLKYKCRYCNHIEYSTEDKDDKSEMRCENCNNYLQIPSGFLEDKISILDLITAIIMMIIGIPVVIFTLIYDKIKKIIKI